MSRDPRATTELLLGLPPLCITTEAETLIEIHILKCNKSCKHTILGHRHKKIGCDMNKEHVLVMGTDKGTN